MAHGGTRTYAELSAFPDDGLRRELLDGGLIVSPAPTLRHQRISWRLTLAFGKHIETRGGGEMFHAPADVILSDINVVEPDLFFVADSQRDILTDANVQGVPSLIIEIVSDPRTDRVLKRDTYARFGVPEYWIVDPDADRIEVYRLTDDRYAKPHILEAGDQLTYPPLPGFSLDLTAVFAR
ncbi:MAG TPA: Uma2 family endonuclease [Actinomycetota bacterium]